VYWNIFGNPYASKTWSAANTKASGYFTVVGKLIGDRGPGIPLSIDFMRESPSEILDQNERQEMRTTNRRNSTRAIAVAGATAVTGLVVALGVSSSWASGDSDNKADTTKFVTASKAKAEARSSFDAEFPDDVKLPSVATRIDGMSENSQGTARFQEGFEESELVTIWRCGWQQSFLNAAETGDADAKERAASQLSGYYELEAVKKWVQDPDHIWHREVIEPALTGDLGPLKDDVANNCQNVLGS
jgi:hypothetical protein